jgi:hypothetical protein
MLRGIAEQKPAARLDVQLAAELIERAKEQGVSLVGSDGFWPGSSRRCCRPPWIR